MSDSGKISGGESLYLGILCGGQSLRMGRDKTLLDYRQMGIPQREFCYNLARELALTPVFSINAEQQCDPYYTGKDFVLDRWQACGPMAGIASLLRSRPKSSWLIIACDMPLLNKELLQSLIPTHGEPGIKANISQNSAGELEPLCALYRPSILCDLEAALAAGHLGLRKLLQGLAIQRTPAPYMDNINTPQNLQDFRKTRIFRSHP